MLKTICVVITILALLMLFHYGRYELFSASGSGDTPAAYKLDRLTGKVTLYLLVMESQTRKQVPK